MSKRTAQTVDQEPDAVKQTQTAPVEHAPTEAPQLPQVAEGPNPMQMLQTALEKGLDPSTIEKLMDLRDRWLAGEAERAYVEAMNRFKADPPRITKNKRVFYQPKNKEHGPVDYRHASLDHICDAIGSALSKVGVSYRWESEQEEGGNIKVTCILTHVMGHSTKTWLRATPDDSGGKNKIQAIGSTTSYLMRYTLLLAVGLATSDMDDDARAGGGDPEPEYIDEKQKSTIIDYLNSTESDEGAFLEWLGVESIDLIPKDWYERVIKNLRRKAKKMEGGE